MYWVCRMCYTQLRRNTDKYPLLRDSITHRQQRTCCRRCNESCRAAKASCQNKRAWRVDSHAGRSIPWNRRSCFWCFQEKQELKRRLKGHKDQGNGIGRGSKQVIVLGRWSIRKDETEDEGHGKQGMAVHSRLSCLQREDSCEKLGQSCFWWRWGLMWSPWCSYNDTVFLQVCRTVPALALIRFAAQDARTTWFPPPPLDSSWEHWVTALVTLKPHLRFNSKRGTWTTVRTTRILKTTYPLLLFSHSFFFFLFFHPSFHLHLGPPEKFF